MTRSISTTIAGIFALAAFAVAVVAGLASGNPTASVLLRAIIAMIICYPVGFGVGMIAQRVVHDQIEVHRTSNPAQDLEGGEDGAGGVPEAEEEEVLVV